MLRKLAALAALSVAVIAMPAGTALAADPVEPESIPTQTIIEIVRAEPGKPVLLDVSATANYPVPPEGDIDVAISAASGTARGARAVAAAPLFTTTVHFVDQPVRVTGPTLPRGRYLATAALDPDDAIFLPSDTATTFRIAVGGETGGEDDDDDNLPNTGGPDMMWLLLGGALVAAGAGGVTYGRRRSQAVPA